MKILLQCLISCKLEDLLARRGDIRDNPHPILIIHDLHNTGSLRIQIPLHVLLGNAFELLQGSRFADDGGLDHRCVLP